MKTQRTTRTAPIRVAAVLFATGLFAGCVGEPNYVVDSTGDETPSSENVSAPENVPAATSERFELGDFWCVAGAPRALFNGENLDGWTNETGGAPGVGWRAESGLLRLVAPGDGGGDLLTRDRFENYVLDFEFRFGKECNSGVKYKIEQPNGKGWVGLEYQIQDDGRAADGEIADRRIASLFDVLATSDSTKAFAPPPDAAPTGDFRSGRIVVFGNNVEHWLDGERVLAFEIGSDAWSAAKNDSKYKNQPSFGATKASPILLQDHGFPIDFRNVKIRQLTGVR